MYPVAEPTGTKTGRTTEVGVPGHELVVTVESQGLPTEGRYRHNAVFADVNEDGITDIVTPPPRKAKEEDRKPHIFLGSPDGTWTNVTSQMAYPEMDYAYGSVAMSDFNGDGMMDMALAMHGIGVRILLRKDAWSWENVVLGPIVEKNYSTRALTVGDMNGDGRSDVVCVGEFLGPTGGYQGEGILILEGEGDGNFKGHWISDSVNVFADDVSVGDVNGDGLPDIAVALLNAAKKEIVWLGTGDFQYEADRTEGFPEMTVYEAVDLVDLDGDGKAELVTAMMKLNPKDPEPNGIRVFHRVEAGWEERGDGLPVKERMGDAAVADFNGDGRLDIAGMEFFSGDVRFFLKTAEGDWKESAAKGEPGRPARAYGMFAAPGRGGQLVLTVLSPRDGEGGGVVVYHVEPEK